MPGKDDNNGGANTSKNITRYGDEELNEFRELITKKLVSAELQLNYLIGEIESATANPENRVAGIDDANTTQEKEYLNQMASRQRQYIRHLENALIRIENKVYGICRVTGKLIQKNRLMAVPHATLSIEAKTTMRKGQQMRR
ncbi:MAG: TraR/DksA family transcriptional regulator [Chitinophagales bacterium]